MAERITRCGEKGCNFPNGKCKFVLEIKTEAETFQVAEENGLPDFNDAGKRWGYIAQELYSNLNESGCVRKDEVGSEMEKTTPDILKSHLSTK